MNIFDIKQNFKTLYCREYNRFPCLDGIRALSIIIGFLFHYFCFSDSFLPREIFYNIAHDKSLLFIFKGSLALNLFFVMSGFVIAYILLSEFKKKGSIQILRFYKFRFMRLMPVYLVVLFIMYLYSQAHPSLYLGNPQSIWANLLNVNNYIPFENQFVYWSWSLAVEEQFYLIFPLFLIVILKYRNKVPVLLILFSIFVASFFIIGYIAIDKKITLPIPISPFLDAKNWLLFMNNIHVHTHTRFGPIVCGVIAAYLHCYHDDKLKIFFDKHKIVFIFLILFAIATIYFIARTPINYDVKFSYWFSIFYLSSYNNMIGFSAAIIILACIYANNFLANYINKFLSLRIWLPISQLAYSGTLFHPLVVFVVFSKWLTLNNFTALNFYLIMPISIFAICVCIGIVSYLLIEKPIMNLRYKNNLRIKKLEQENVFQAS